MQPSNQLKGLVESYGNVYANRQQTEELKQIAESIINCVGVHMVENGYVESDVKEFFERSSIGKILDVFEQALDSEEVLKNINESTGLYETHLRYIPGAMATRMKNESPEIVNRLASRLNEEDLQEFLKGWIDKGKRTLKRADQALTGGAVGRTINQGVQKGKEIVSNVVTTAKREVPRAATAVGGAGGRALEQGIKYTAGSALAGPLGGAVATQVPSVTSLIGGGRNRRGPGQGSGRPTKDPTASSRQPSTKQPITPITKQPAPSDGTGPLRPRAGDERARPTTPPASTGSGSGSGGGRTGGGGGRSGGGSRSGGSGGGSGSGSSTTTTKSMDPINVEYDRLRKKNPTTGRVEGSSKDLRAAEKFGKAKSMSNKPKTPNPLMRGLSRTPARTAELAALQAGAKAKSMAQSRENRNRRGARFEENEFELVVQHLFTEGYAETLDGALSMVEGMSDQFINNILEQVYMESAMVEFLIQSGEAESIEEANYIISELDEENLNLLIQSVLR